MDVKMKVDTEMAEHAFEQLRTDGARVMENSLRNMAHQAAAESNARAPGGMRGSVTVHDLSRGEDHLILLVAPKDLQQYDGDRVAWWTSKGTATQRAQRWFRKVPKAKQRKQIMNDLVRTARRLGFKVNGS